MLSDSLAQELNHELIGQEHAVRALVRTLLLSLTWPRSVLRPIGMFLLLGPPGTGKGRLPYSLARALYGNPQMVVTLNASGIPNGSAFADELFARCSAIPPPPAPLTLLPVLPRTWVAKSVIVLEEMEKAEATVFTQLSQAADIGFISAGGTGRLDLRRSLLIMKSELASEQITDLIDRSGFGFRMAAVEDELSTEIEKVTTRAITAHFHPEFLNRLDGILVFRRIKAQHLSEILDRFLLEVGQRLRVLGVPVIGIVLTQAARKFLLDKAREALHLGYRPLFRLVEDYVEFPLVDLALGGRLIISGSVVVDADGEAFHFSLPGEALARDEQTFPATQLLSI